MRNVLAFVLMWIGLILQSSIFQVPPFNVIQPTFVLVVVVMTALTRGARVALILGILIGFVQDIDYGTFLGLNAFAYGVVGYFSASVSQQFLTRNLAVAFFVTVLFTFIYEWISYGMTRLFDVTAFGWSTVFVFSLRQMIVNGVTLLLLYPMLNRVLQAPKRGRYREETTEA